MRAMGTCGVLALLCSLHLVTADSKPFGDSILFKITWPTAGSVLADSVRLADEVTNRDETDYEALSVVSVDKERYRCLLPKTVELKKDDGRGRIYARPTPLTLLKPLFVQTFCSYRLEQYWTYELCHGRSLRQYHEESLLNRVAVQEYFLGKYDANRMDRDDANYLIEFEARRQGALKEVETIRLEGMEMPYFAINMSDGTLCDINGLHRSTRVLYVCNEDAKNEILSLEEVSTCEYQAVVLTPFLCAHPDYRLHVPVENNIRCLAQDDAAPRPKKLLEFQREVLELQSPQSESLRKSEPIVRDADKSREVVEEAPPHDPKLVKDFLSGDHCLTGGSSGWWKYEFCYGKKVLQFHEEKGKPRVEILLGKWDRQKHVSWLKQHPTRKPIPGKVPRHISHFYSGGDVCDATQNPRAVEVKLRCRDAKGHPDSVTLYLMEPKTCEYILVVESPIVCSILENIDEYGLQVQEMPKQEL